MGFGYGRTTDWYETAYSVDGTRARKVYDSSMVAHIWNAESQTFARTSNGNFAFVGDTLYSYGRGWIVAKLFHGAALINNEFASVTTRSHESDARNASSNRPRFELPAFPRDLAIDLDRLERGGSMKELRDYLRVMLARESFLDIMQTPRLDVGESSWGGWNDETNERIPFNMEGRLTFGEWLCTLYGLNLAVARNAAAKLIAARAKAKADKERAEHKRFLEGAIQLADMSGSDFRAHISVRDSYEYAARQNLESIAKTLRKARLKAGLSKTRRARLWEREKVVRARLADVARIAAIASRRSRLASLVRYVRSFSDLGARQPGVPFSVWSSQQWRTLTSNLAELSGCAILPEATRLRLGALSDACDNEFQKAVEREREERRREVEDAERLDAERKAAWLNGESSCQRRQWSREDGTPYLRVFGNELQTSWGASVPLSHAVKVFRFVKLCRERGEEWKRNGKTIRVGHFQVDSVSANGDFVAGCHRFAWPEVERAAVAAGVFNESASADAVEESN